MRGPAWMLLLALAVIGAFACLLRLEGAPCNDDDNCPNAQYCGYDGGCVTRPIPLDLACQKILHTLAQRVAECRGGDPGAYELLVGEKQLCGTVLSGVDAGREVYDPAAVTDCRAALAQTSCDNLSQVDIRVLLSGCQVLTPQRHEGEGCSHSLDCVTTAYCDTSATCPGICRPLIPPGAACDPAGAGCEPGSVCFGKNCTALLSADAGCFPLLTPPCGPGLGCVSGHCAPQLTTDGGCTGLIGTECAPRYSCVGSGFSPHTCQPAKDAGDPCTPGLGECGPLLWCGGAPAACRPWAHRLESCGLINGELVGCLDGRCLNNTCDAYADAGEQCTLDSDCGPAGRCAPVADGGTACQAAYCN